jgi:hypothetical protein
VALWDFFALPGTKADFPTSAEGEGRGGTQPGVRRYLPKRGATEFPIDDQDSLIDIAPKPPFCAIGG